MKIKKPKFWDYNKPNINSYLLWPISIFIKFIIFLKNISISPKKYPSIKTICIGNIYLGGTGKTSLCLKIKDILEKNKIKTCFVKKYYSNQFDEQTILENKGKLFKFRKRSDSIKQAIQEKYEVAIFDDGLQDNSIKYDLNFVCFNNINWIGNGLTIPSGPLREGVQKLKKYKNVFLNGNEEDLKNIKEYILNIDQNINIYEGKYIQKNIKEFDKKERYLAFSGIGNHNTFVAMLKINGLNIVQDLEFPDHYLYSESDIKNIITLSKELSCKIITTEKDYIRLNSNKINDLKIIKSELEITNEREFLKAILKLHE